MAPSQKQKKKKTETEQKQNSRVSVQRGPVFSSSHLLTDLEKTNKQKNPKPVFHHHTVPSQSPLPWRGAGSGRSPFTSALLSAEGTGPLVGRESQTRPWWGVSRPAGSVCGAWGAAGRQERDAGEEERHWQCSKMKVTLHDPQSWSPTHTHAQYVEMQVYWSKVNTQSSVWVLSNMDVIYLDCLSEEGVASEIETTNYYRLTLIKAWKRAGK